MTVIDDKRRTGRTTRMMEAVYNWVTDPRHHAVVFVMSRQEVNHFSRDFLQLCIRVGAGAEPATRVVPRVYEIHHFLAIDWELMRLQSGLAGVPASFRATSETCRVFVDHAAIERMHGPMLEAWCRYDPPAQGYEEDDTTLPLGERSSDRETVRVIRENDGSVTYVSMDEAGQFVVTQRSIPRPSMVRQRAPAAARAVDPTKPEPIVKPGERRLILRRPAPPTDKD